jgi:hypothetical protein
VSDGFRFDLAAKRTRLSDEDLVLALQAAAEGLGQATSPQRSTTVSPGSDVTRQL